MSQPQISAVVYEELLRLRIVAPCIFPDSSFSRYERGGSGCTALSKLLDLSSLPKNPPIDRALAGEGLYSDRQELAYKLGEDRADVRLPRGNQESGLHN